jgi:hypothetical protein
VFLEKLSIPITDQVRQFGEWAAVELRTVMQRLFYEPPLTVIHHDFQADNLLFGRASDAVPLVVIDWQMLVRGRGPADPAYLLSGSMDPEDRRRHELDLVTRYAVQLEAAGIRDYVSTGRRDWSIPVAIAHATDHPAVSQSGPGSAAALPWELPRRRSASDRADCPRAGPVVRRIRLTDG